MKLLLLLLLATAVLLGQLVAGRPQRLELDVGEECRSREDCKSPYICTSNKCAPRPTKSYKSKSTKKPKSTTTQTKYCPTSVPSYTPPAGVGERCYSNYDCPDKLACIYNKCAPTETPEPSFGINLHDCVPVTTYGPTETTTSAGYETPTTTTSPGYETATTTTSPSYESPTTPPYESPTTPPYESPTTPDTSTTPYSATTTTTTTTTSPTTSPTSGGGTCSWPGHCEGDTCRYDDECEQTLSCQDGRCTAA